MRSIPALLGLVLAACGSIRRPVDPRVAPAPRPRPSVDGRRRARPARRARALAAATGHREALRPRRQLAARRQNRPRAFDACSRPLPALPPRPLPRLAAGARRLQRGRRPHQPGARAAAARVVLGARGEWALAAEEPGLRTALSCGGACRRARAGVCPADVGGAGARRRGAAALELAGPRRPRDALGPGHPPAGGAALPPRLPRPAPPG